MAKSHQNGFPLARLELKEPVSFQILEKYIVQKHKLKGRTLGNFINKKSILLFIIIISTFSTFI